MIWTGATIAKAFIYLSAWEADQWVEYSAEHYKNHQEIFERLGVPCEAMDDGDYLCKFDEPAIRDYQLLHILLHELGHHHDRMSTQRQKRHGTRRIICRGLRAPLRSANLGRLPPDFPMTINSWSECRCESRFFAENPQKFPFENC